MSEMQTSGCVLFIDEQINYQLKGILFKWYNFIGNDDSNLMHVNYVIYTKKCHCASLVYCFTCS